MPLRLPALRTTPCRARTPAGASLAAGSARGQRGATLVEPLVAAVVAFAAGTLVASLVAGRFFNKRIRHTPVKDIAYECGMLPQGEGSTRLSVKFYLVAMLFILFDIEVVFMYPWAIIYKSMLADPATRNLILGSMLSFLGILFVGYIYAVKKKAFDWKS